MNKRLSLLIFMLTISIISHTSIARPNSPDLDDLIGLKIENEDDIHFIKYRFAKTAETLNELILDKQGGEFNYTITLPQKTIKKEQISTLIIPALTALGTSDEELEKFNQDIIQKMNITQLIEFIGACFYLDIFKLLDLASTTLIQHFTTTKINTYENFCDFLEPLMGKDLNVQWQRMLHELFVEKIGFKKIRGPLNPCVETATIRSLTSSINRIKNQKQVLQGMQKLLHKILSKKNVQEKTSLLNNKKAVRYMIRIIKSYIKENHNLLSSHLTDEKQLELKSNLIFNNIHNQSHPLERLNLLIDILKNPGLFPIEKNSQDNQAFEELPKLIKTILMPKILICTIEKIIKLNSKTTSHLEKPILPNEEDLIFLTPDVFIPKQQATLALCHEWIQNMETVTYIIGVEEQHPTMILYMELSKIYIAVAEILKSYNETHNNMIQQSYSESWKKLQETVIEFAHSLNQKTNTIEYVFDPIAQHLATDTKNKLITSRKTDFINATVTMLIQLCEAVSLNYYVDVIKNS
jgi:hypothetical protein